MAANTSEADWRVFRELREVALDRFCKRVLQEVEAVCADALRSHHERYLQVYRLVQDRDEQLARAFNDPRRSQLVFHLAAIRALGLLKADELARLSPDLLDQVDALANVMAK